VTHSEFVAAFRAGRVTVEFDPKRAANLLSARLLLPLMALPVLGIGVALALMGWLWTGLALIALGFVAPRLIKRSAPHFLLTQMLEDARHYEEICQAQVMQIVESATEKSGA
jgi:hypothetical protein